MLRDDLRTMIDRYTLTSVLDSLGCAVLDLSEEEYGTRTRQQTLEQIGKGLSKLKRQASKEGF